MNTQIQYRTFDELLDSVRIDLKGFDYENIVEPQELIKVAVRVNKELGLRINPTAQKCVDVVNGQAALPADMDILNFAFLCESHGNSDAEITSINETYITKSITDADGNIITDLSGQNIVSFTTMANIANGSNKISHGLNTFNLIVQASDENGQLLDYGLIYDSANSVTIVSNHTQTINNVKVVVIGNSPVTVSAEVTEEEVVLKYVSFWGEYSKSYKYLCPIRIVAPGYIAPEGFQYGVEHKVMGELSGNQLLLNTTADNQSVYFNYQSVMEDENGQLLVADHPVLNEYYEYALKKRILENLLFTNEPNVAQKLQYYAYETRLARNNAISLVRKPEYTEIRDMWEKNRRAQVKKYFSQFVL